MWNLLTASDEMVIGVERYVHRAFPPFSIAPELFQKERFFNVMPGDTFYSNLAEFNEYYGDIEEKFDSARIKGDKIPKLYESFGQFFDKFPDAKVVFMLRNIFDVAASYKARAMDETDSTWHRDHGVSKAIADWTNAIAAFKKFSEKFGIFPVCYEDLFIAGAGIQALANYLDIDPAPLEERFQNLKARSEQLETGRSRNLTAMEVLEISIKAPFGGYREIIKSRREN